MDSHVNSALPAGLFELDARGRVLSYGACQPVLRDKPRGEVIGRDFFAQVLGGGAGPLQERFERVLSERLPVSKVYLEGAGRRWSVLMMFFPESQSVTVQVDQLRHP
jgi:hypothetical protein